MSQSPVPPNPDRDDDPPGMSAADSANQSDLPAGGPAYAEPGWQLVPQSADWPEWMVDEEWLAAREEPDEYEDEDPDSAPPPGMDDAGLAELAAEARAFAEEQASAEAEAAASGRAGIRAALGSVCAGRRGPGMPGSASIYPGEYTSRAAGFASGMPLDAAPGHPVLALLAAEAAGEGDRYAGASDDELLGVIGGWDRVESNACARKHAALGELLRRRPGPDPAIDPASGVPQVWDEFVCREVGAALALSAGDAEAMLGVAAALEISLPGTRALFWSGVLTRDKAVIIAGATALLDKDEARAAEALVLGRAGTLTPAGLRAAIARAVMQVNPDKARKRREHAAKLARVQRWPELSGNAGLTGRELPPAQVLAADQRITWWARQLKKAGMDGGMDALRARAFLDILLGTDSRPPASDAATTDPATTEPGHAGPGGGRSPDEPREPVPAGPLDGAIPPGFTGHTNMTIPALTLLHRADRPGEMAGIGPLDPALARDLAAAAARSARSTWCLTVTDQEGHAIGHGCARPAPRARHTSPASKTSHTSRAERGAPGTGSGPGPDPPGGPAFTLVPAGQPGPPGGYGTWRFSTGVPGQRDMIISIEPIPTGDCDHRHQANGHDPGIKLRHLTQIRHATCTGPGCRRPAERCDYEHNIPYEAGGRTCLCNGNPTCRHDHRMKQNPRWTAEQLPTGHIRWTTPSGRQYTTEPTRYPI